MGILEDVASQLGGTLLVHEPLAGGVSARVIALDLALSDGSRRRVVVRQPGAAEWKDTDQQSARREFELLAHLHQSGLPVPQPLLLQDQRQPPFFVMAFVEGTAELPADGPERMAELLVRVHAHSLEDLPGLPGREDPIASIPQYLSPEQAALRERLAQQPPTLTSRRTLLHGDFWPGNVLWRGNEVAALLD